MYRVVASRTTFNALFVVLLGSTALTALPDMALAVTDCSAPFVITSGQNITCTTSADIIVTTGGNIAKVDSGGTLDYTVSQGVKLQTGGSGSIVNAGSLTLLNNGTLTTPNTPASSITQTGGSLTLTNNGTITRGATNVNYTATTINITGGTVTITNNGTISNPQGSAISQGSSAGTLTIINNSGGIISGGTNKTGITLFGASTIISNSGTISGGGSYPAISLNTAGAGGTLTLNIYDGAVFTGGVNFNNKTNNTINFYTGSYTLGVQNYNVAGNTINLLGAGNTLITSGLNGSGTGNIVVVATPMAASVGNVAPQFTRFTSNVLNAIVTLDVDRPSVSPNFTPAEGDATTVPGLTDAIQSAFGSQFPLDNPQLTRSNPAPTASNRIDAYGNLVWTRAFFGNRLQPGTTGAPGQYSTYAGVMAGYDRQVENWRIGGFFGYGSTWTSLLDLTSRMTTDLYFGGVYSHTMFGPVIFDAVLSGGIVNNRSSRSINAGAEWAQSTGGGFFLAPELALGYQIDITPEWSATPTLRGRYVGSFFDGYAETGSSQNATYGATSSHAFEERLELRLAHKERLGKGRVSTMYAQLAGLASQRVGADSVNVNVLSTDFTATNPYSRNVVGASVGIGFDHQMTENVSLFGGLDGTIYSDSATAMSGRAGVKVSF